MEYEDVFQCACGAVTVTIEGQNYSMPRKEFNKRFDAYGKRISMKVGCCDYCVNHWGIDLCGCGSGEKFGQCKEGHGSACKRPAQDIENAVSKCYSENSWF